MAAVLDVDGRVVLLASSGASFVPTVSYLFLVLAAPAEGGRQHRPIEGEYEVV